MKDMLYSTRRDKNVEGTTTENGFLTEEEYLDILDTLPKKPISRRFRS